MDTQARTGDCVVLDTNIVLDLFVFGDLAAQALKSAVITGRLQWLATAAMRVELARVLDYPQVAKRMTRDGLARDTSALIWRSASLTSTCTSTPPGSWSSPSGAPCPSPRERCRSSPRASSLRSCKR